MKTLSLNQICHILNCHPIGGNIPIKKVVTDVAHIDHHTLVFHLNKEHELNWERFLQLDHCFIITDQPILETMKERRPVFFFVSDIETAYQKFITYYRQLFDIPVVAITGTCGKTTTKDMIKQVLERNYPVASTLLSKNSLRFNHDYLMSIDDKTKFGVFETALTEPGHILYSCHFFKPSIGVITNIGIDHLSGCKTLENYIRAKAEMLSGLDYKGTLIINYDDENIRKIDFTPYKGKIITFGLKGNADFKGLKIHFHQKGMRFTLKYNNQYYDCYVPGYGKHNVYNALAAMAVLKTLGMDIEVIIKELSLFKPISSHMEFHKGINGSIIVDDTWSSNPTSLKAAFEVFNQRKEKKIAVLGNISYLGDYVKEQCQEMGKMLNEYKIDYLVTKDAFSKQIAKAAIEYGMDSNHVFYCHNEKEFKEVLSQLLKKNTIALFKFSMYDKAMQKLIKQFMID